MSYQERDNQVILTMSREDYEFLMFNLGACITAQQIHRGTILPRLLGMMNRLNSGNPHYTPYQVEAEKK
jgi:hypothetical protein